MHSGQLYAQILFLNIKEIVKIKKNFLNLSTNKIKEFHKIINKTRKEKPNININFKSPSQRQVFVSINQLNSAKFIVLSNKHISNINRALKDIKSDTVANFIHAYQQGLTITTNKVALLSILSTIEKYIKNIDAFDSEDIIASRLPQSKSYLKILGISYLIEDTNTSITSDIAKRIIKSTYIFNNIVLISKLRVIKMLFKYDIVVV